MYVDLYVKIIYRCNIYIYIYIYICIIMCIYSKTVYPTDLNKNIK